MENEKEVDGAINSSVEENNEKETQEMEISPESENDEGLDETSEVAVEALKAELERERIARQQLTARARKAEAELLKVKQQPVKPAKQETSPDLVDERVLKAYGMPDELLKELKLVAQVRGVPLIEAQNDPVFKVIKDNYEKEQKSNEASLGASKGSGSAKAKKTPNTPNLGRDEHKKMFKEMLG